MLLKHVKSFLQDKIKDDLPILRPEMGKQSLNFGFQEPSNYDGYLEPRIKIFARIPVTPESEITSIAIAIGKNNDHYQDRDQCSLAYFGYSFRDLQATLEKDSFECEKGKVYQITFRDKNRIPDFIDYIIQLYIQKNCSEKIPSNKQTDPIEQPVSTGERASEETDTSAKEIQSDIDLDQLKTEEIKEAREQTMRLIEERSGQQTFRQELLGAYESCCAITGCTVIEVLEAAHIIPYREKKLDLTYNGLLLRADLHTLFDKGLICISEKYEVQVHSDLMGTEYSIYNGRKIRLPSRPEDCPNQKALAWHRENIFQNNDK